MVFENRLSRTAAMAFVAVLFWLPLTAAHAATNTNNSGVALLGYDPVAYFEIGKPTRGKRDHAVTHKGATYYFASAKHREAFTNNPDKYVPAYGGWCSYGMRYGQKSRIDPNSWDIVDGRLYMTLNEGTRAVWRQKVDENITVANKLWQRIFATN